MSIGTAFKVYVFPNNSPWGVVRKADGTLQYKHTLRFETDELRESFIRVHLNDGRNYQDDLEATPERAFTQLSDTRIHFNIADPSRFNDLLNADFAVAKLGNRILFYALKILTVDGQNITYEGELDIFFSFTIRFRENSENTVLRAHANRLNQQGSAFKVPNESAFPALYYGQEPLDLKPRNELVLTPRYSPDGNLNFPAQIKWLCFITHSGVGANDPASGTGNRLNSGITLDHSLTFIPFDSHRPIADYQNGKLTSNVKYTSTTQTTPTSFTVPKSLLSNPFLLNIYISDIPPISFADSDWIFSTSTTALIISEKNNSVTKPIYTFTTFRTNGEGAQAETESCLAFMGSRTDRFSRTRTIGINFNLLQHNLDPKILSEQYFAVGYKKYANEPVMYSLKDRSITGESGTQYIHDYENKSPLIDGINIDYYINNRLQNEVLNNRTAIVGDSETIPIQLNKWAEYYLQNKNAIQARKQRSTTGLVLGGALGVLGLVAAPFTGGTSLGLAAVGVTAAGVSGIINYSLEMNAIAASKKDKIAQGNIYKSNGDDYARALSPNYYQFSTLNTVLVELAFQDAIKLSEFVNKFGYSFGGRLKNLNQYLSSRTRFNFIQAVDAFNTLDIYPRVSSPIKQIIGNAFENGITFWHYRTALSWLGVLNYNGWPNRENNWNVPAVSPSKKKWLGSSTNG